MLSTYLNLAKLKQRCSKTSGGGQSGGLGWSRSEVCNRKRGRLWHRRTAGAAMSIADLWRCLGMGWEGLKRAAKASANFVNRPSWSWRSWLIYIDLNHSLWADPIPCWKVSAVQAGSFLKESDLDVTLKAAARSFPKSPQQALQWIVS